jgi:hypothetical protein
LLGLLVPSPTVPSHPTVSSHNKRSLTLQLFPHTLTAAVPSHNHCSCSLTQPLQLFLHTTTAAVPSHNHFSFTLSLQLSHTTTVPSHSNHSHCNFPLTLPLQLPPTDFGIFFQSGTVEIPRSRLFPYRTNFSFRIAHFLCFFIWIFSFRITYLICFFYLCDRLSQTQSDSSGVRLNQTGQVSDSIRQVRWEPWTSVAPTFFICVMWVVGPILFICVMWVVGPILFICVMPNLVYMRDVSRFSVHSYNIYTYQLQLDIEACNQLHFSTHLLRHKPAPCVCAWASNYRQPVRVPAITVSLCVSQQLPSACAWASNYRHLVREPAITVSLCVYQQLPSAWINCTSQHINQAPARHLGALCFLSYLDRRRVRGFLGFLRLSGFIKVTRVIKVIGFLRLLGLL